VRRDESDKKMKRETSCAEIVLDIDNDEGLQREKRIQKWWH
jgi:hypothetical protein